MERDLVPAARRDVIGRLKDAPGSVPPRAVRRAGLLLTGGASRRLGTDKAIAVVGGMRLADRAARILSAVCDPVIEVGPGITLLPACREDPPGGGPLAALVAGTEALGPSAESGVVLLGCDLPGVDRAVIQLVADWPGALTAVPVEDGYLQLVCARYGAGALEFAALQVGASADRDTPKARSLHAVAAAVGFDRIEERAWRAVSPGATFADVDSREDLNRWQSSAHLASP